MKKTPNQIREELRRKMAANHENELERLRQENLDIWHRYRDVCKTNTELSAENEKLKEQVRQYEDWNNRLMEYMDLSEEDRKTEFEILKLKLTNEQKLASFTNIYSKLFSLML